MVVTGWRIKKSSNAQLWLVFLEWREDFARGPASSIAPSSPRPPPFLGHRQINLFIGWVDWMDGWQGEFGPKIHFLGGWEGNGKTTQRIWPTTQWMCCCALFGGGMLGECKLPFLYSHVWGPILWETSQFRFPYSLLMNRSSKLGKFVNNFP